MFNPVFRPNDDPCAVDWFIPPFCSMRETIINCFILSSSNPRCGSVQAHDSMHLQIFSRGPSKFREYDGKNSAGNSQKCCFPHYARAAPPTAGPLTGPAGRRTCTHRDQHHRTECSNANAPISCPAPPGRQPEQSCTRRAASALLVPRACLIRAWPRSTPSQTQRRYLDRETTL